MELSLTPDMSWLVTLSFYLFVYWLMKGSRLSVVALLLLIVEGVAMEVSLFVKGLLLGFILGFGLYIITDIYYQLKKTKQPYSPTNSTED